MINVLALTTLARTKGHILSEGLGGTFWVSLPGGEVEAKLEGYTGDGDDVSEILVGWEDDCDCGRPCCSGTSYGNAFVAWSQIIEIMHRDGWTVYAKEVEDTLND